jgi:acyl-CoA reductase-like NAD-dependent aldehyde dehydrogenase
MPQSLSLREPVGVAGQIIPWNYPLLMAAWKLAPAHGRRLHLRPEARRTNAADRARNRGLWFDESDLPPGVVNIVTGFGETAGAPLVAASRRQQDRLHRQRCRGQAHRETARPTP